MDPARYVVCAAIMINALELVVHLSEEWEYIWLTIRDFTAIKAFYIFSRYSIFLLHYEHFASGDVDPSMHPNDQIEGWRLCKTIWFHLLLWSLDFPYMKIVYLLFGGTRKVFYLLAMLGVIKLCTHIALAWISHIKRLEGVHPGITQFGPDNLLLSSIYMECAFHSILLYLAIAGSRRAKYSRTPVTARLVTNGATLFVGGLLFTLVIAIYMQIANLDRWFYSIVCMTLSFLACRLILFMQRAFYRKKRITFDTMSSESSDQDEGEDDYRNDDHPRR